MKIGVIGSGSWGSALSMVASRAGNQVSIWSRNEAICDEINIAHTNSNYLKHVSLDKNITATTNLKELIDKEILLISIPAQSIRLICEALLQLKISKEVILVICSKGIEQNSLKLISEVIQEFLPNPIAVLSGPNFALEIAKNLPAISCIAAEDKNLSRSLVNSLSNQNFRIYSSDDIIGCQIIGAAKNVLAIATGITIGKKLGENAKSAIFSRGICEIKNLLVAKNGKIDSLFSPAGIGDLNLTCSSSTSRNTSFGIALAEGKMEVGQKLVEGFFTAESITMLAKSLNIEMPIAETIYKIAHQNYPLDKAIEDLLKRNL